MSDFTLENWQDALSKVYTRSTSDDTYRQLCLTDPRAAVAQVSDIELPTDFNFTFFDTKESYTYSFLLPPALSAAVPSEEQVRRLVEWKVFCTDTGTH
jgi:hypothetical protein